MADDRMKHDDLDKDLGGSSRQGYGQQSPGHGKQDDKNLGQRGSGQGMSGKIEDDEDSALDNQSGAGNRQRQNR